MKIYKVVLMIFIIFCGFFTCLYGKNLIDTKNDIVKSEEYQGVITLWQIDEFEGGVGSRKQFLLKVARSFEKKYNGVLVMVSNFSKQGAEENIKNGIVPDMISFSNGVEVSSFNQLNLSKTTKGGMVGNISYAVVWCRGGYVLIENPAFNEKNGSKDKIIVSQDEFTQPIIAMCEEKLSFDQIEVCSPMDAYVKFVSGKYKYMLGTQRDINRLQTRDMQVNSVPITKYNDLYQYISIMSESQIKKYYSELFIDFLLSENSQKSLSNIGMMSCYYTVEFENEHLNKMQKVENKYTIPVFTHCQVLKEMQEISIKYINGDKEAENKIKNLLI